MSKRMSESWKGEFRLKDWPARAWISCSSEVVSVENSTSRALKRAGSI